MREHHTMSLDDTADIDKGKAPLKPALSASTGEALQTLDISIGGMTCPHCPAAIEKALHEL